MLSRQKGAPKLPIKPWLICRTVVKWMVDESISHFTRSPPLLRHCLLQVVTAFLSAVSLLCCLLAFCRHSLHLYLLYFAVPNCAEYPLDRDQSPGWLLGLMDVTKERNDQFTCHCSVPPQCAALVAALSLHDDVLSYVGLSCVEVKRVLPAIITVAAVLNFVGLFLSAWFAGLVTCSRNNRRFREWRTSRSGGKFAAASLEKKSKTVAAKGVSADAEAVRPMIGNGAA